LEVNEGTATDRASGFFNGEKYFKKKLKRNLEFLDLTWVLGN